MRCVRPGPATRRLVGVLVLLVAWAGVTSGTQPAAACSCADPDLAPALSGDPDHALVLAERTDLDGGPGGSLRVLRTLAGGPVTGPVDATFDDGGSCDPGVTGGGVAALLLARASEGWRTTVCGIVPIGDALLAADVPVRTDPDAGPPTLVVAGAYGGARLAGVDAAGRVAAWGEGGGRALAMTRCPGGDLLVEVATTDAEVVVQRWSVPDLRAVGPAVPLDVEWAFGAAVRCLDAGGERVQVALPGAHEPGALVELVGTEVSRTPAPIRQAAAAGGTLAVVTGDPGLPEPRTSTIATVGEDGELTELTSPAAVLDRLAVSPSGRHVLAAGYPEGAGDLLVVVGADGEDVRERQLAAYHHVGWLGDDRVWLRREGDGAPFGSVSTRVDLLGTDLTDAGPLDVGVAWQLRRLDDDGILRFGVAPPSVRRGEEVSAVDDPRLTATTAALPLDATAVLTAASSPTPTTSTPTTSPVSAGTLVDAGGQAVPTAGTRVAAGLAVLVLVGAAWAWRRDRRTQS